jgi:NitT/TauT family transport system substrate-binding protein
MFGRCVSRSVFAGLAAVAALAIGACGDSEDEGGAGGSGPQVKEDVRFTIFPGAFPSLGVYIADTMGYFEEEGIKVEYVNVGTGSSATQVLSAGDTDFIVSDITGMALARKQSGAESWMVAGQFKRFMADLSCRKGVVPAGQEYPDVMQTVRDLKVGITAPGSATDTYLRYSMIDAGVEPEPRNIIGAGGVPQLVAAMKAKRIDCVVAYQPMQKILADDVDSVLNWAEGEGPELFNEYVFNGIITSQEFAEKETPTVDAVSRAMKKAVEFGSDPANAPEISEKTLKYFQGIKPEDLESAVRETAPTFGYDVTPQAVSNALEAFNTINPKQKVDYAYEDLVAPSVADELRGDASG